MISLNINITFNNVNSPDDRELEEFITFIISILKYLKS